MSVSTTSGQPPLGPTAGIISKLAENRERNAKIADHYVTHRERYGRTMIFVDRWFQCEAIQGPPRELRSESGLDVLSRRCPVENRRRSATGARRTRTPWCCAGSGTGARRRPQRQDADGGTDVPRRGQCS